MKEFGYAYLLIILHHSRDVHEYEGNAGAKAKCKIDYRNTEASAGSQCISIMKSAQV